ncbi:MAG: hypothetical protein ACR2OR_09490 [Hyphomicrobiales bacterium]
MENASKTTALNVFHRVLCERQGQEKIRQLGFYFKRLSVFGFLSRWWRESHELQAAPGSVAAGGVSFSGAATSADKSSSEFTNTPASTATTNTAARNPIIERTRTISRGLSIQHFHMLKPNKSHFEPIGR